MRPSPGHALPATLLILMALACLPLAPFLPWWSTGLALTALAWRGFVVPRRGLPAQGVRWLLAIAVATIVFLRFHTVVGERPGLSFFVMLVGLKLLESDSARDQVVLVLFGYLALMGGLLFAPTPLMGLYTLGFAAASFVALSLITQPSGPAMRARWRLSVGLLAQALPVAFLGYLLFPRIAIGLWHSVPVPVGRTGLTSVLRPGSLEALLRSRQVALRALFQGPKPPKDRRYFRAYVLTATNGRTWRAGPLWHARGHSVGPASAPYTILLNPTGNSVMPALDWPARAPRGAELADGDLVRRAHPIEHVLRYTLTARPIRRARLGAHERAQDLALPRSLDPRIRALARRLASHRGPLARIHRTLGYFVRHHFTYTLTPPPMGRDPTAGFLFRARSGYCEDYASAFAILMRAEGVPARVVVGYFGGEFNPVGGDVIVREWDAHSWTEVFVRGRWRRIDPTAVVAPASLWHGGSAALGAHGAARAGRYAWWRFTRVHWGLWLDAATTAWDNWVVDYNARRQDALLRRLGWRHTGRAALAAAVVALALLVVAIVRASGARAPRRDPARRAYDAYARKLARVGLAPRPWEGPKDHLARASVARPDLEPLMSAITAAYVAARYDGRPEALKTLRTQLRAFRPRRSGLARLTRKP